MHNAVVYEMLHLLLQDVVHTNLGLLYALLHTEWDLSWVGVVMWELGCVGPHCHAHVNSSHGHVWPHVSVRFVADKHIV